MKRIIALILCICVMSSMAACSTFPEDEPSPEEVLAANKQAFADFRADFEKEVILAVNARVITDENGDRMLLTDIKNTSDQEATNIVLCFAIWDAEGNFLTILSRNNPTNTYSEFQVEMGDRTVAAGETWEATAGLFLAEECPEVAHVEAAVISCTLGSTEYTNRVYDAWKETYLNQKLEDWMR